MLQHHYPARSFIHKSIYQKISKKNQKKKKFQEKRRKIQAPRRLLILIPSLLVLCLILVSWYINGLCFAQNFFQHHHFESSGLAIALALEMILEDGRESYIWIVNRMSQLHVTLRYPPVLCINVPRHFLSNRATKM